MQSILVRALLISACFIGGTAMAEPNSEVMTRSDLDFQSLNPARGDAAPKAGVLWGDLKKNVPTGALIEFADGFSSPPHIHNITYRAVVISGAVHNDDPQAEKLWMGPGSFWTQAAGESHITAASKGNKGTAFLEILEGPYLVQPTDAAFDSGERSVNVDARNMVWLDSSDTAWIKQPVSPTTTATPEISFLWGSPQDGQNIGTLLKLPASTQGELRGNESWLRAVIIQGRTRHRLAGEFATTDLEPGSYFGSKGKTVHSVECQAQEECLIYVRTQGKFIYVQHYLN